MKRAKWHVRNGHVGRGLAYDDRRDWWGDGISAKAFIEDLRAAIPVERSSSGSTLGATPRGFAMYRHTGIAKIVTATTPRRFGRSVVAMPAMINGDNPWSWSMTLVDRDRQRGGFASLRHSTR